MELTGLRNRVYKAATIIDSGRKRPQIIKKYAAKKSEDMFSLMFNGSKGTYLLMYLFALHPAAYHAPEKPLHLFLLHRAKD